MLQTAVRKDAPSITCADAGLSLDDQLRIILRAIAETPDGCARMRDLYRAINKHLGGARLSPQGENSLRKTVNTYAVERGLLHKYDPWNPGWRITQVGRIRLESIG